MSGFTVIDDQEKVEFDILRDFYACWKAFHAVPKGAAYDRKRKLAAQRIVDAEHSLLAYRNPTPLSDTIAKFNGADHPATGNHNG